MMRATKHSGRTNKDGAFSSLHNDRNFDLTNASHIDISKTPDNKYLKKYEDLSFDEVEEAYYKKHFAAKLNSINENYIKNRHPERCRTMDDYRKSKNTCPEEEILQLGNVENHIDGDTLWQICIEQLRWEQEQFPNVRILNVSLHVDEATPHVHVRKVWVAHENNMLIVNQKKALEEMNIQAPDPHQKIGRYNNPKMTYTQLCREHFLEICRENEIEIETEPLEASRSGLTQLEYKRQQEEKRIKELQEKTEEELKNEIEKWRESKEEYLELKNEYKEKLQNLQQDIIEYHQEKQRARGYYDDFEL